MVHLAAEVRSFERAEIVTQRILGYRISCSTIRRLAQTVGQELADLQSSPERINSKQVVVPEAAVVSCDGGRIRARQPDQGRGVCLAGENGWRETKNASFERMHLHPEYVENEDACPELPSSFCVVEKVANLTGKAVAPRHPSLEAPPPSETPRVKYAGPQRVLRTALSSLACSDDFGPMMQREAQRRRFYEAPLRVFLGDGLPWNWSIWKKYFPSFLPVLDFIHAIQYVYAAAMAVADNESEGWATYFRYVTWCWQGQVVRVIAELTATCAERGVPCDQAKESDSHKPLVDAVRYLTNNQARMDYPRYRRHGLPVTSAPMESLIKQINLRVKGTEMFWDDPAGAEAILHLRAAVLSEDDRLNDYLMQRPGHAFRRRTTLPAIAA